MEISLHWLNHGIYTAKNITDEIIQNRKNALERRKKETEDLKNPFSKDIDGLITLNLFTGSIKQLLEKNTFQYFVRFAASWAVYVDSCLIEWKYISKYQ